MDYIGVKNKHSVFRVIIIFFFVIAVFFTPYFWVNVDNDLYADSMFRYGKEVQAEITDMNLIEGTDHNDESYSYWKTYYEYVDNDGRKYTGGAYSFDRKSQAEEWIGKTVRVVINPITGESEIGSLAHFREVSEGYRNHLIHGIAFSAFLAVISVPFFYRVVFRVLRNKKIVNKLKSKYVDKGTINGEVVKTFGLVWFYIKVRFTDEFGIAHEKWAGDWFTRKEANFLKEKKCISIVPYKNSYGILEEMPTAKKQRKSKNK